MSVICDKTGEEVVIFKAAISFMSSTFYKKLLKLKYSMKLGLTADQRTRTLKSPNLYTFCI